MNYEMVIGLEYCTLVGEVVGFEPSSVQYIVVGLSLEDSVTVCGEEQVPPTGEAVITGGVVSVGGPPQGDPVMQYTAFMVVSELIEIDRTRVVEPVSSQ